MATAEPFDPSQYVVVVEPYPVPLRAELEEVAAQPFVAHLVPWDESQGGDPRQRVGEAVGSVSWLAVRFGMVADAGVDALEFADRVSGELVEVARVLLDEDGGPREFAGAAGTDLLYFTELAVRDGKDFFRVAVELIEFVIGSYGAGCFGAAYDRDRTPRLELERALRDRGFGTIHQDRLHFLSFEQQRPSLPCTR